MLSVFKLCRRFMNCNVNGDNLLELCEPLPNLDQNDGDLESTLGSRICGHTVI